MQFCYYLKPTRWEAFTDAQTPHEADVLSQHVGYLRMLQETGVLIFCGGSSNAREASFGIVIFNANDEQAAQRVAENDPAIVNGVLKFTLFPFFVGLMADRQNVHQGLL